MSLAGPLLGEEHVPVGEAELIARTVDVNLSLLETSNKPVARGEHPKAHGLVLADFIVEPNLPQELRVGVFREPGVYRALLRFSNGRAKNDNQGDIHGLGIKLLGVPGEKLIEEEKDAVTQDFVLADHPVFFIPSVSAYVPFSKQIEAARNGLIGKIVFILRLLFLPGPPWSLLRQSLKKKPDSPLRIVYWSQTPYKLGSAAVHYFLEPKLSLIAQPEPSKDPDKLRLAMIQALFGSCRVQLQRSRSERSHSDARRRSDG